MKKSHSGFTLIELIIVIVILGILAAIAFPKFVALQRDARIAKLQAARGAVLAASALARGAYLARVGVTDTVNCAGGSTAADNLLNGTLCTENGLVQLANGYVSGGVALAAATPGIIGAAGLSSSYFSPTLTQLNSEGYGAEVAGAVTTFSVIGGPGTTGASGSQTNPNCSFTYTSSTGPNIPPVVSAITTSGC